MDIFNKVNRVRMVGIYHDVIGTVRGIFTSVDEMRVASKQGNTSKTKDIEHQIILDIEKLRDAYGDIIVDL